MPKEIWIGIKKKYNVIMNPWNTSHISFKYDEGYSTGILSTKFPHLFPTSECMQSSYKIWNLVFFSVSSYAISISFLFNFYLSALSYKNFLEIGNALSLINKKCLGFKYSYLRWRKLSEIYLAINFNFFKALKNPKLKFVF